MNNGEEFLAPEFAKIDTLRAAQQHIELGSLLASLGESLPYGSLKAQAYSRTILVAAEARRTLRAIFYVLARHGEVLAGPPRGSAVPCLAATVLSGFLNLNRTMLVIHMVAVDGAKCTLVVSATAKEGLITQRSADKAVLRFERELREALA